MGQYPCGAPLEVTPVTNFVIALLEMAHEAQVRCAPLLLAGVVWAVLAWAAPASYLAFLEKYGSELEKSTGWERQVLLYHRRMTN